jgi:hypothetical protein
MATEKYITGYACKGNQSTGAIADLFNDMVNCADDSNGTTGKSLVTKLLMGTVKRDISAVEASYELSSLPLYRSSHTFQSVSLSGARILQQNKNSIVTKNTPLDRYLTRPENYHTSLYDFICKSGKVPVISGCCTQASWPLNEDFCKTMLLLHWPNWRNINEIKEDNTTWTDKMNNFLVSEDCPNFVKAEVERAKTHHNQNEKNCELPTENLHEASNEQPEWMELIRPNITFDDICKDFEYDDGGPEYD